VKAWGEKMVCYTVPLAVAIVSSILWGIRKRGPAGWWLNLMLYGGGIFGVVDHLWNGELFLTGRALVMDLMLGIAITAAIFTGWGVSLGIVRSRPGLARRMGYRLGTLKSNRSS
jgi:hypothetical protein